MQPFWCINSQVEREQILHKSSRNIDLILAAVSKEFKYLFHFEADSVHFKQNSFTCRLSLYTTLFSLNATKSY